MGNSTIEQIEFDIEITLARLHDTTLTMKQWEFYIRQYHALIIKYLHQKGEPIITDNSKHKSYYGPTN